MKAFKVVGSLTAASIAIALLTAAALAATRDKSPLIFMAGDSAGEEAKGKSTLVRDADAGEIASRINAKNLVPGDAYTYWYVVFNNPDACIGECGEDDIFNPDETPNFAQIEAAGIAVLGGNGQIANGGGNAVFRGGLIEGSDTGLDVVIGPGALIPAGPGMLQVGKTETAEIHIILRNHGPAETGALLFSQLNTFAGNCIGLDPTLEAGEGFDCVDEQFAIHK